MHRRQNPLLRIIIVSIVSILIFQAPLAAKKARRGATVEVRLTDGGQIRGELLAVKDHEILVFDPFGQQGKSLAGTIVGAVAGTDRHSILTDISPESRARILKSIKPYARESMN